MIPRFFCPLKLLKESSHFLLGPRDTGKSSLIKKICWEHKKKLSYINLEDSKSYLKLKSNPFMLPSLVDIKKDFIVIDEMGRAPELLSEIHRMIEDQDKRFLLIANSTQKFKHKGAGLLKGSAPISQFFPLGWFELEREKCFSLPQYLRWGGLPLAYLNRDDKESDDYLYHYIDTYIQEEIYTDPRYHEIANFVRFFESAAQGNAQVLDYQRVAREAKLSVETVEVYYGILVDTLMGFEVASRNSTPPQFYFFDTGIVHILIGTRLLAPQSELYGRCFRQFIACELRAYLHYKNIPHPLQFWRSSSGEIIDFIIGDQLSIQVIDPGSPPTTIGQGPWRHRLVISEDIKERSLGAGVRHLHWQRFMGELWRDEFEISSNIAHRY